MESHIKMREMEPQTDKERNIKWDLTYIRWKKRDRERQI